MSDNRDLRSFMLYPAWSPAGDQIVAERAEVELDLWTVSLQ